jgi:predicted 3-demethylubiquinone-9 3-methyltransferase (glyoxalase superfamily)
MASVEEAAKLYVSVFPNSEIKSANPMSATVVANCTEILMFNGGPRFKFTPGISILVKCKDQAEVDLYWNKLLSNGGREDNCGWLQDKWGVSWQIIPDAPGRYLSDPDREKANRACWRC